MAVIEALDLFLSSDTGPMHMACAVDTPSVSVFGPTDPVRYFSGGRGDPGSRHVVLRAERDSVIGPEGFKEAASVEEPAIGCGDHRLFLGEKDAVQPDGAHVRETPSARAIAAALIIDSSYSAAGSESATMPPPAWK